MQRVLGRLRPGPRTPTDLATRAHRRSLRAAHRIGSTLAGFTTRTTADAPTAARLRAAVAARIGSDRVLPVAVAGIVLVGSLLSVIPDALPGGPVGGPSGDGPEPRLAVGGGGDVEGYADANGFVRIDPNAVALEQEPSVPTVETLDGPYLADGTLVKPVVVDTSVADGSALIRTYRVRPGDTLVGIADSFDVSMMTVWWANKLTSKDDLRVNQVLRIPPVNGLVVTVAEGDTLESLAAKHKIEADTIYQANSLEDRALVIGQTLILPGAKGAPIPTPKPTPKPVRNTTTVRAPTTYRGGTFVWPVVGGGNYISQYFHYGHYGLDIAADYGSKVRAAAAGTVIFAGWKNNGGGYQVHISHGSGLYTTYNHMSGVSVGRGQAVARGQQVGRIGATGYATGPHLHFEVWRGGIWNGGRRVNPLIYL